MAPPALAVGKRTMPRTDTATQWTELTLEERRELRRLRREKQREDNIRRAAKMQAARLKKEKDSLNCPPELKQSVYVGCSGWRYWKWRDSFYSGVPQQNWFEHYLGRFDTVEINASFYSWPTVAGVQAWRRHHEAWRHRELNHMGYSFDGACTKQAAEYFSHFPLRARKFMA